MLSVVCVYNNQELLERYLLQSLSTQTALFELITVDNTQRRFESAAEALNYGGAKARGRYIAFVHQDVFLEGDEWLNNAEKMLDSLSNIGIAGIAGSCREKGELSGIMHGNPPKRVFTKDTTEPVNVQTLDECLVIVPRAVFEVLQFDETACDNWHLYAVEYCLSSQILGLETFVVPLPAYHLSTGGASMPTQVFDRVMSRVFVGEHHFLPREYYKTLKKVLKKHARSVRYVHTTNGWWTTKYPILLQRIRRYVHSSFFAR